MGDALIGRRELLEAAVLCLAATTCPGARAMGRLPLGGKASAKLPHDTSRLDPHDLFNPAAAILGAACFDTVYALDAGGNPYAALADGMPHRDGHTTRVQLREGLRSARGHAIDARDLVASIERSRRLGGSALLADVPAGTADKSDLRAAVFRDIDAAALAHALASPIVALISRHSSPGAPDGTGAFRVDPSPSRLVLTRNRNAARGFAYLEEISLERAADLGDPLRAFEAQSVDIGWLGDGYHQPRPGSIPFDLGPVGWVVLRTGAQAGTEWGRPGVAQAVVDAIEPSKLARFALGKTPPPIGRPGWGGAPCPLFVDAGSAYLTAIANTVAGSLSTGGNTVTATPLALADLTPLRKTGSYALMMDVVRPVGPPGLATLVALATADDPATARSIVRHPPRLGSFAPRVLARTLHLGVVGELRVLGATIPQLHLVAARDGGWDLGASYRS